MLTAWVQGTDPDALDYALNRAMDAYYNDRQWFHGLQKRVMEQVGQLAGLHGTVQDNQLACCVHTDLTCTLPAHAFQDWSWNKPAHDYIELYYAALK